MPVWSRICSCRSLPRLLSPLSQIERAKERSSKAMEPASNSNLRLCPASTSVFRRPTGAPPHNPSNNVPPSSHGAWHRSRTRPAQGLLWLVWGPLRTKCRITLEAALIRANQTALQDGCAGVRVLLQGCVLAPHHLRVSLPTPTNDPAWTVCACVANVFSLSLLLVLWLVPLGPPGRRFGMAHSAFVRCHE